jgi:pyruvate ferredoxin oxidoreductase alpha subunit
MQEAHTAIFILNSAGEIAKNAVKTLNSKGKKVGVIRPNIIRPFPIEDIMESLKGVKQLIIAERADNPGSTSSFLTGDLVSAIQNQHSDIKVQTMIYGLGGKEIFAEDFEEILTKAHDDGLTDETKIYYGAVNSNNGDTSFIERNVTYNPQEFKVGGFKHDYDEETSKLTVKIPPLRSLMKKPKRIAGGHSACPGCGIFPGVELFLRGIEGDVVLVNQTGCAYVVTANYPYSAHKGNYIHNLFQNGASTLSGVVDAIMELKDRDEIEFDEDATFVMLSGDGGMDIGMGAAIGAALRNHKMIILEYDNEGYMNTGAQLSYSTPIGHRTSTSNVGSVITGKEFDHKDTVQIMAATNIPYCFTGVDAFPQDLVRKAAKAQWYANKHGLVYGKILIACPLNWKSEEKDGSTILEAAVNCNFFPLYEIENGITTITHDPNPIGENVDAAEWLKYMGKSKHLLKPENEEILNHFRTVIEKRFAKLKAKHEHPEL